MDKPTESHTNNNSKVKWPSSHCSAIQDKCSSINLWMFARHLII